MSIYLKDSKTCYPLSIDPTGIFVENQYICDSLGSAISNDIFSYQVDSNMLTDYINNYTDFQLLVKVEGDIIPGQVNVFLFPILDTTLSALITAAVDTINYVVPIYNAIQNSISSFYTFQITYTSDSMYIYGDTGSSIEDGSAELSVYLAYRQKPTLET